ncbi:hypothetical protein KHS38_20710 [Mucilaginibacter sp. Bleaf8]|uniref:plasmid mobilization protein n=1 Tax=Mucilaginibacter sp. Bleaf8 TaxID=2834430 RepID=UPI001BD195D0|nr:hypothetical protein [Mucilaginibacter sp. Bleaf8]MBS7566839.1 hypothetical protein [Mucilaginibacter sp. Bleaf8]
MESAPEPQGHHPIRNTGGRPKSRIKKDDNIKVRVSATQRLRIAAKAEKAGLSLSEFFRQAALKAVVRPRMSKEEAAHYRTFAGAANNFNQFVKMAHQAGILTMTKKGWELLHEIENILKRIKGDDRES